MTATPFIGVVDYGRGNLRSVAKALEHVGAQVKVSASPQDLDKAAGILVPGVGAFGDAMAALKRSGFDAWLKARAGEGRPLLGVCLGLQLFCLDSTEFGRHKGLGFFDVHVRRLSADHKVPNMGWSPVKLDLACPLFKGLKQDSPFYFLHSYRADLGTAKPAGLATLGRERFSAALWQGNIFATQFHPEKSQADGLKVYANFWKLCRARAVKRKGVA